MNAKRTKMKSSGKGIAIIALILGAVGLSMGLFSFIQVQTTKEMGSIVGQWESLSRDTSNPDYSDNYDWLVEVDDMRIMNSEYVTVDQTPPFQNTRFHLVKIGWYRIDVNILLTGITTGGIYAFILFENGELNLYIEYFRNADTNEAVNTRFFIYNNGSDYFEMNLRALGDSDFTVTTVQTYNQMLITYIG
jgi:hypothetical protein